MNNFTNILVELGVPTVSMLIATVSVIIYAYMYFKLYEDIQAIILTLGILSLLFSACEFSNTLISINQKNTKEALFFYKLEELILTITIIPWYKFITNHLVLNRTYKYVLEKSYILIIFIVIIIVAIGLLYPQLFLSENIAMSNENITMVNSIKSRGSIRPFFIFRNLFLSIVNLVIIYALGYEVFTNKDKSKIIYFIINVFIILAFFDNFNGVAPNVTYIVLKEFGFSRTTTAYTLFNIFMIYFSVKEFISALYIEKNNNYNLSYIKSEDTYIINKATITTDKLLEIKEDLIKQIYNLISNIDHSNKTINKVKEYINNNIRSINEKVAVENFQVNDASITNEKIDGFIELYPLLESETEKQKDLLNQNKKVLEENISQIYSLQSESFSILSSFKKFVDLSKDRREIINKELNRTLNTNQLTFQINKILSLMITISDKTKTLSVNSSIQASKSAKWMDNFTVISKEVNELVFETISITDKMRSLLYQIEDIFKKFDSSNESIKVNVSNVFKELSNTYERLNIFNKGMEKQNDYNMTLLKNIEKVSSTITLVENIIINEKNDFINIKTKIQDFINYINNISENTFKHNNKVKSLIRDINKLLAISDDLENIIETLDYNKDNLLKYSNYLQKNINEYYRTV